MRCRAVHFTRDCEYQSHTCSKCDVLGHKEGYCAVAARIPESGESQKNYSKNSYNRLSTVRISLLAIPNDSSAFRIVNRLAGRKSKRAEECNFVEDGKSVESIEGKAEVMKQYYENLYKETTPNNDRMQLIEEANAEADQWKSGIIFSEKWSALKPKSEKWSVSSVELECIKKKLNNKKSSGSDGISNYIIKKSPKIFWDITRTIPKTAAAAAPKDFRPISMVSNWGKLLEEVIMVKMKNEDGQIKGVPDNQFAYRMGHSALHAADWCVQRQGTRGEEGERQRL